MKDQAANLRKQLQIGNHTKSKVIGIVSGKMG